METNDAMNILFDADVLLDVFMDRDPHEVPAYQMLTLVERGHVNGWLAAGTVSLLYYLLANELEQKWVKRHINEILQMFTVIPVTNDILTDSIRSKFKDFDNAVLYFAAEEHDIDYIITRNKESFKGTKIQVYSPREFLSILRSI